MREKANVIRSNVVPSLQSVWETMKEWAERPSAQAWMADALVTAATVLVLGLLLATLHQAAQSYTIVGF